MGGSWAFGEVVAEDSLLRHVMSLSQFPSQTWKTTLWPLQTHIVIQMNIQCILIIWIYECDKGGRGCIIKCDYSTHHLRSTKAIIRVTLSQPLQLAILSVMSIVSFSVSWIQGHLCLLCLTYLLLWPAGLWFLPHGFTSGQKSCCHLSGLNRLSHFWVMWAKKTVLLPILIVSWQNEKNHSVVAFYPLVFCLSILGLSATLRETSGLCVTVKHLVPKQVVVICGLAVPLHGKHWLRAQES